MPCLKRKVCLHAPVVSRAPSESLRGLLRALAFLLECMPHLPPRWLQIIQVSLRSHPGFFGRQGADRGCLNAHWWTASLDIKVDKHE